MTGTEDPFAPEAEDSPTARVIRRVGEDLVDRLRGLSGSDLTTLLLEVMRGRAEAVTPAAVVRQHERDRFVAPTTVAFERMRTTETAILRALPPGTETIALAPMVPFGTHRAVASIDPRWTIPTIRGTEVAADPTNGLALIAATRRRDLIRDGRTDEVVRLAASQRVARSQLFQGTAAFAHFQIVGLVTAGRGTRDHGFEREAIGEHVRFFASAFSAVGARDVRLGLTDLTDGDASTTVEAARAAAAAEGIDVVDEPDRTRGRGYYRHACFQMYARLADGVESIADGGFVDWIAQLTASRTERSCISGIGLERLTLASSVT